MFAHPLFLFLLDPRFGIQDKNPESATLVLNLKNGRANNNSEWIWGLNHNFFTATKKMQIHLMVAMLTARCIV
jgi:hypothetical protein